MPSHKITLRSASGVSLFLRLIKNVIYNFKNQFILDNRRLIRIPMISPGINPAPPLPAPRLTDSFLYATPSQPLTTPVNQIHHRRNGNVFILVNARLIDSQAPPPPQRVDGDFGRPKLYYIRRLLFGRMWSGNNNPKAVFYFRYCFIRFTYNDVCLYTRVVQNRSWNRR